MTDQEHLRRTQEFFGARAVGWEKRFPDDTPQFQRAVDALELTSGVGVLDAGCGTGRALPLLRAAVGPGGTVVGLDATPAMLAEARRLGRHLVACLALGDVDRVPLGDRVMDAVLAAGLLPHLRDVVIGLAELARVTRPGGRLAIFHPIGRAALAARHGGQPSNQDPLEPLRISVLLNEGGWALDSVDDAEDRYLALATRFDTRAVVAGWPS